MAQQIEQKPNGFVLLMSKEQEDVDATKVEENYLSNSDLTHDKDFDYQHFISAGFIGALVGSFVYPYAYARLDVSMSCYQALLFAPSSPSLW